jgi:hypothetical protein
MSTTSDRSQAADTQHSSSFLLLVYANAFITGAVVMGFEMLGSRYLNPFFGSGIYTWAALISTVLAALTAGYFFGGWMADRNPRPSGLGWLIVAGSAYLAFIPLFADGLLDLLSSMLGGLADQREFERWGSIAGAMLLLFVPLGLLGVYSPYAIRLTLRATTRSGTVAGRIYGISTMGSRHITYLLSAIGVAAGLSFLVARPARARRALPAVAAALLAALLIAPESLRADPPVRAEPAQVSPSAKEMAERFVAFLRKSGAEVKHGAIEDAGRGFRIKDLVVTGTDRLRLQSATLTAAALEAASFEEKPGDEMALAAAVFAELVLTGKDGEKTTIARLSAEGFSWSGAGRAALRGLAVRDVVAAPRAGEEARMATLEAALFRIDSAQAGALERLAIRDITTKGKGETGRVAAIDVEQVQVDFPQRASAKGIAVRDIAADTRDGTIRIAAMELRSLDFANMFLNSFEFAITGIEAPLDTAKDPAFARDMKELGYTALRINSEISYRYDEAAKSFNLARLAFDVADMGAITLALRLSGITAEDIKKALEPPPGQAPPREGREGLAMMGLMSRLNLVSADLSIRDKSILGRVIKREALKKQTDEASIRAQYRALLQGLRDEQPDALVKDAIDAVIAFLDNPGELAVEVRPPAPINVLAISALAVSSPAQLRAVLGIKITAKKP